MPVMMRPAKGKNTKTKPVRHPDFHADGPYEEHFDILRYYDTEVDRRIRKDHTKTITGLGKLPTEEFDQENYMLGVIAEQCKSWRVIAPDDQTLTEMDISLKRVEKEGDLNLWKYSTENIAEFPWDLVAWLWNEIQRCGGIIPTRSLIVTVGKTGSTKLDFRGAYASLGTGDAPGLPHTQ